MLSDKWYNEVKINYEYIDGIVKEILLQFKGVRYQPVRYLGMREIKKVAIVMCRKDTDGTWGWIKQGDELVWTKEFAKLNANEMQYFEGLIQRYCDIKKISDVRWELTLTEFLQFLIKYRYNIEIIKMK